MLGVAGGSRQPRLGDGRLDDAAGMTKDGGKPVQVIGTARVAPRNLPRQLDFGRVGMHDRQPADDRRLR